VASFFIVDVRTLILRIERIYTDSFFTNKKSHQRKEKADFTDILLTNDTQAGSPGKLRGTLSYHLLLKGE